MTAAEETLLTGWLPTLLPVVPHRTPSSTWAPQSPPEQEAVSTTSFENQGEQETVTLCRHPLLLVFSVAELVFPELMFLLIFMPQ